MQGILIMPFANYDIEYAIKEIAIVNISIYGNAVD
jgi:hypothetical protein